MGDRLKWYVEAERTHGRWAMIATAGILGQECLGLEKWFLAGAKNYGLSLLPLIEIQSVVMGFIETKRFQSLKETTETSSRPPTRGGSGWTYGDMGSPDMQLKEIKNGRLA